MEASYSHPEEIEEGLLQGEEVHFLSTFVSALNTTISSFLLFWPGFGSTSLSISMAVVGHYAPFLDSLPTPI
jgi:hypothetical protein